MAVLELVALDETIPQLLAPTASDEAKIVGDLTVDGTVTFGTLSAIGGTLLLESGSITDSTGDIDFGNENLTTTGTITAGSIAGLVIGTDVQAQGDVLDDLNTLGAAAADGEFIVATGAGAFAYESGATARTSIGLGTTDSPEFAGAEFTGTSHIKLPVGTDAQRPETPTEGDVRRNTTTAQFEGYDGSSWGSLGGGAGSGGKTLGYTVDQATAGAGAGDYTLAADQNMVSPGPITITTGDTITIASGARMVVI